MRPQVLLLCDLAFKLGSRARKRGDKAVTWFRCASQPLVLLQIITIEELAARTRPCKHGRVSPLTNHPFCRWGTFGASGEEDDRTPSRKEGGQRQQGFVKEETGVADENCPKAAEHQGGDVEHG